jgi:pyruvate, water dikinase
LILGAGIPDDLWAEIRTAYDRLCEEYGPDTDVAVRSSATAEDLPTASFAGQQETYLNISGYPALREACSKCLASLFTNRAISYRIDNNFDHFEVALSIGIMKMVRSDLATSGVMFTIDTETGSVTSFSLRHPTVWEKTLSRELSALMSTMFSNQLTEKAAGL